MKLQLGVWGTPRVLRGYSQLCTQGSILVEFREPYRMLRIEPTLAICKANVLSVVLFAWPQKAQLAIRDEFIS